MDEEKEKEEVSGLFPVQKMGVFREASDGKRNTI